jgi:DNA-binding GntR family transcriptional regulator
MHSVTINAGPIAMPVTRAGAVAAELRRLIQAGEFAPGARLQQVDLAKRFGVSTTPVREAFATLVREGLVRQDTHRGVVVFQPSVDELAELYEIRGVLEPLAAELAAKNLTTDELHNLRSIVMEMRSADPERSSVLNREFHRQIAAGSRRQRLAEMIYNLRDASAMYLRMTVVHSDGNYSQQAQTEHEAILEALEQRRPAQARRAVADHLNRSAKHRTGLIQHP